MDDEVLRRWMQLDAGRLNLGLASQQLPLATLLAMREPAVPTRDGGTLAFDAGALRRLHDAVPILLRHRLRLPVTIWEPSEHAGDGYVEDEAAIEALVALGEAVTRPRAGRLWMASHLWREVAARWPTCFQVLRT